MLQPGQGLWAGFGEGTHGREVQMPGPTGEGT